MDSSNYDHLCTCDAVPTAAHQPDCDAFTAYLNERAAQMLKEPKEVTRTKIKEDLGGPYAVYRVTTLILMDDGTVRWEAGDTNEERTW